MRKKRHLLNHSDNLKKIFKDDSLISYRRGRSLKDQLVHSKTKRIMTGGRKGAQGCGKNCVICQRVYTETDLVRGPGMTCTYDRTIGCKSSNVVYGIFCEVCECVCYVGETGDTLYTRSANHLSTIRTKKLSGEFPVAVHFNSDGHSIDDVKFVGLERVWCKDVVYRRLRERRWIDLLGTSQYQGGLNVKIKL